MNWPAFFAVIIFAVCLYALFWLGVKLASWTVDEVDGYKRFWIVLTTFILIVALMSGIST